MPSGNDVIRTRAYLAQIHLLRRKWSAPGTEGPE
jgi:hypothetical protein